MLSSVMVAQTSGNARTAPMAALPLAGKQMPFGRTLLSGGVHIPDPLPALPLGNAGHVCLTLSIHIFLRSEALENMLCRKRLGRNFYVLQMHGLWQIRSCCDGQACCQKSRGHCNVQDLCCNSLSVAMCRRKCNLSASADFIYVMPLHNTSNVEPCKLLRSL